MFEEFLLTLNEPVSQKVAKVGVEGLVLEFTRWINSNYYIERWSKE